MTAQNRILDYPDQTISCQIIPGKRKTWALELKEDGRVFLRVPKAMKVQQADQILEEYKDWIYKKYQVHMEKPREVLGAGLTEKEKQKYRKLSKSIFEEKVYLYSRVMGVSYNKIFIREQKTRWGSCSSEGNLNFNWKLLLTRPELVDYVVVHELAHRKQMNHSKAFWAEVEKEIPDWRTLRKQLQEYRL